LLILSRSSLSVGSELFRRMRLSSKEVGIVTFSRALNAGMENWGMVMLMLIRLVKAWRVSSAVVSYTVS